MPVPGDSWMPKFARWGLEAAVLGHAQQLGVTPSQLGGTEVGVVAADGQGEALDEKPVESGIEGDAELGRGVRGGGDGVVGGEVEVTTLGGVGVRGGVEHVLLAEADVGVPVGRVEEGAAGDAVEILGDEGELAPAALQDDHPRKQARELAGALGVGAHPALGVVPLGRRG